MKTLVNFWKRFIRPTDIILIQILRPPENIRTVNLTFYWWGLGNTLQQERVAKISAFGMNPSQLVDVAS